MSDESDADLSRKVTDRDLARLMKRGIDELADDPAAVEIHERIRRRDDLEQDRSHRDRSERSAAIGFLAGLAILVLLIAYSVATFER
ncbi:hypothetical protein [Streptomyces sp. NPDC059247]|uniref:hypothetical protein n=1 Tax=Streptomyces sp. NPDC059247 TaxID=3346790 RepID=UPI0036B4C484